MSTVAAVRRPWRRQFEILLDGDFPWGAVISAPSRYGASQQQLIVYPPGISGHDRRWLRLWRGWTIWGGLLWLVLQVWLSQVVAPWEAFATSVGVSVVAGAAAWVGAGETRHQVRTYNACVLAGFGDAELLFGQRKLRLLTTILVTADAHYRRGELSMVDYEQIWWQVYDAMTPTSDALSRDSSNPLDT